MSLPDAVRSVLSNYANFNGRARRSEYWYWVLTVFVIYVVGLILTEIARPLAIVLLLALLAVIVPTWAVGARRLHDTGKSGWLQLITIIPVIGGITLIVLCALDSEPDNQYGPNPKGTMPGGPGGMPGMPGGMPSPYGGPPSPYGGPPNSYGG